MRNTDGWGSLEVRHLRAFLAVAERRSFSGAAGELGYTQSAVSQQLGALEQIVGAPLFMRSPGGRRPVELTQAGEALVAHAEAILARASVARADLEAILSGERGTLRIITIQSVGARILPDALARFRAAHPGIQVEIHEATSLPQLAGAVERGAAHIGFAALPTPPGPFVTRELLADPYVLVTPTASDVHSLRDLDGHRLLGIRGCKNELLIEQHLLAGGIVPSSCERFDDNALIQALVAADEGIAVVPRLTIDPTDPRIAVHALPDLHPRQLTAITHAERHLPLAATRFIETTDQVCAAQASQRRPRRRAA